MYRPTVYQTMVIYHFQILIHVYLNRFAHEIHTVQRGYGPHETLNWFGCSQRVQCTCLPFGRLKVTPLPYCWTTCVTCQSVCMCTMRVDLKGKKMALFVCASMCSVGRAFAFISKKLWAGAYVRVEREWFLCLNNVWAVHVC